MSLFGRSKSDGTLELLRATWENAWEPALEAWSRFTKLRAPLLLVTEKEEKAESLSGSFAMIRLVDHTVVVSLRQIANQRLDRFATEILAHEIGHHVYAPGDLGNNARLIARIRRGLPGYEQHAPFIANLYTDLLINDRLQRTANLDMAGVYKNLAAGDIHADPGSLWTLYLRIYELLWGLAPASLTEVKVSEKVAFDAPLGAKVIRVYAKDWLDGAGRFAVLCYSYLLAEGEKKRGRFFAGILDTRDAGVGGELPDGLTELDDGEETGAIHPADDPVLTGVGQIDGPDEKADAQGSTGRSKYGGNINRYRDPSAYRELMKSLGVTIDDHEITIRYYKERARPHLIRFPVKETRRSTDPLPEGLDPWEAGESMAAIDWMETITKSPAVIPGVTTVQRAYGHTEGGSPEREPLDLYIGIDCSGSMRNPQYFLSYPILAATIITLSALRTGAKVMACLSGAPGKYSETPGFIRGETELLKLLTGYLGTGFAYGVDRLKVAILDEEPPKRPTHLFIVTDRDIFMMLGDERWGGWEVIREAAIKAGGGATMLLHMNPESEKAGIERIKNSGWNVHCVVDEAEMVTFARAFAKQRYDASAGRGA
jgi:hypothetical protein